MVKIRNESDFRNWFKKNYKKLGFSEILKSNTKGCPDFIMLEGDKKVKVELEIKTSNFILHKHSRKKVDKIICAIEDIKLKVPTIKIKNVKLIEFDKKAPYSFKELIFPLFKKEPVLTTTEVSKKLDISKGAAEKALMELVIEDKIDRIKKEGIILWLPKD